MSAPQNNVGDGQVSSVSTPLFAPVTERERISALDVVRGCAVLGILLLNIVAFAYPYQAYDNPRIMGKLTWPNVGVWAVNFVLFDGKMRAIFSMLFGAGVVLLTSRAEERHATDYIADIYYRRTIWLLIIGLFHAFFIWSGDILYAYAITGMFLFPLRKVRPARLIGAGTVVLALMLPYNIWHLIDVKTQQAKAVAAEKLQKAGKQLSNDQKKAIEEWNDTRAEPPAEEMKEVVADHRSGYLKMFLRRAHESVFIESDMFYPKTFLDALGMMLIGMGLLKLGFFSAQRSYREYAVIAVIGYAIGIAVNSFDAWREIQGGFDPISTAESTCIYDFQRLIVALAHVSVLMMIAKSGLLHSMTSSLGAVGRTALSNYLLESIVCTIIFDGFKLFGRLQRFQLYFVVIAVWIFQLVASRIWLKYFRFGPAEWLWRSLTYQEKQPMRLVFHEQNN
jgi:uncharacterized protein